MKLIINRTEVIRMNIN